jgi:alpha-L-fucosidase 2
MDHFRAVCEFCMAYQPMADLYIETGMPDDKVDGYRRILDLDTAVNTTTFAHEGVTYTREVFASHPDRAIYLSMTADKPGKISFTMSWGTTLPEGITASASGTSLGFNGQLGPREAKALAAEWTQPGLKFAGMAQVEAAAGTVTADGDKLVVSGADAVTIIITAATSFVNPDKIDGDENQRLSSRMAAARQHAYPEARTRHMADHQALMRRAKLELPAGPNSAGTTDQRLREYADGKDPALAALLFNYGRYLLIASSRPGTQPANLQGIWNDNPWPAWGSKYTININAEMNYWPAGCANLSELQLPLFDMIEEMVPKGRDAARSYYGASGWVAHHNTDLWRNCAPVDWDAAWFPTSAAWLCTHIWSHYEYTGDRAFLERMYPVIREACAFYFDFLAEHPEHHEWLVTCPTHSPEHGGLKAGTTMDNQILREFFDCAHAAGRVAGEDEAFLEKIKATRKRLPPNKVGKHGQLQEWLEDIDDPGNTHRHVSHMWGVFPGSQISTDTPKLLEAAKRSLDFRGDAATGWSVAWKSALWARMGDGDRAHKLLSMLLSGGCYPNLFDVGPPFQIDGNFGIIAGISEMLLQTHRVKDGVRQIDVLPSLPSAWPEGRVTGLRVPGGFEVDMTWNSGGLDAVGLKSVFGTQCQLNYRGNTLPVSLTPGERNRLGPEDFSPAHP